MRVLFCSKTCINKLTVFFLSVFGLFVSGCHSLDDDAKFQKHTQGYIVHTKQSGTHNLQYIPVNSSMSVLPVSIDSTLQHLLCAENELFIPQANLQKIQILDLNERKIKEEIAFDNDFYPVDIVQHPDKPEWFFIASQNGKIAFYNRKKNKKDILTYANSLHHLVYANEKLYGASQNTANNEMIIVDVPTRALIKKETLPTGIKQLHSQTLWVKGLSTDSLPVSYTLNVNDDILQKSTYSYPLQEYAYSPYTQQFYGKEFIGFVENYQGKVYVNQVQFANSDYLTGFIPDFDESRLITYSASRIYHYENMRNLVHTDSSLVNTTVLHGVVYRK